MRMRLKGNRLVFFLRLTCGFDEWRTSNPTVIAKQGACVSRAEGLHPASYTHTHTHTESAYDKDR